MIYYIFQAGKFSEIDKQLRTSDRGFKFLQVYYVHDDLAHYTVSKDFVNIFVKDSDAGEGVLDRDISLGMFSGVEDPTTIAYDDYDTVIGLSCK